MKLIISACILMMGLIINQKVLADSSLEKCLSRNLNQTSICAKKYVPHLNSSNCFSAVATLKSDYLRESLRSYCFYDISDFTQLNSCLFFANKFIVATNHDDAIFNCVQTFKPQIDTTRCVQISKLLRYPEKRKYLNSRCDQF